MSRSSTQHEETTSHETDALRPQGPREARPARRRGPRARPVRACCADITAATLTPDGLAAAARASTRPRCRWSTARAASAPPWRGMGKFIVHRPELRRPRRRVRTCRCPRSRSSS
ncbi:MAG: hypothetical protein MZW92_32525 [Comamonadaceae bacterium]|nr:hypothetical protein [Comamonadaceae bacterium]